MMPSGTVGEYAPLQLCSLNSIIAVLKDVVLHWCMELENDGDVVHITMVTMMIKQTSTFAYIT